MCCRAQKTKALGVGFEVGLAEGLGVGDEKAKDPPSGGTGPYSGHFVWFQPNRDELRQGGPIIIEHPECAVTGPGYGTGFFDHMAEEYRQLKIPLKEQGRLEDPPEFGRILNGVIGHKTAGTRGN
jgi:hypothetical protein